MWIGAGPTPNQEEIAWPTSLARLCVTFGAPYESIEAGRSAPLERIWIAGPCLHPRVTRLPSVYYSLVALITPMALSAITRTPAHALFDRVLPLREFVGHSVDRLFDLCVSAPGAIECFDRVEAWVASHYHAWGQVEAAVDLIDRRQGRVAINEVRSSLSCSRWQLDRAFAEQVGMTAKRYARLARLTRTLHLLQGDADLVTVAGEAGYFDQAHMNKETLSFCGHTPSELRAISSRPHGQSALRAVKN
ncbi:MAG: AraC family transcriptional regulator [Pseudomonadales bacterium]|nr:AraC family transcriptional regulator [Pseudomonadales bacterium]